MLQGVVENDGLERGKRAEAAELLAICYLLLGEVPWAEKAFSTLLQIAPNYRLRLGARSKRVTALFADAKGRHRRNLGTQSHTPPAKVAAAPAGSRSGAHELRQPLTLRVLPKAAQVKAGHSWLVQVLVSGAAMPKSVTVYGSLEGQPYFDYTLRRVAGRWTAAIPMPTSQKSYKFKYFVEARDAVGKVVARLGKRVEPLIESVAIEKKLGQSTPIYKRWWLWTIVGVAVVGATTAGLVVGLDRVPEGSLAPGVIVLR